MPPDRYARTAFIPADQPGFSAVRLLDPADETRVIGTISTAQLRARPNPFDGKPRPTSRARRCESILSERASDLAPQARAGQTTEAGRVMDRVALGLLVVLVLFCLAHLVGSALEEAAERRLGPPKEGRK